MYSKLCKYNKNSTQIGVRTRNYYDTPTFNKNVFKYSFTRISINILNLFLNKYIKERQEQIDQGEKPTPIKNYILDKFTKDNTSIYNDSKDSLIEKLTGFVT